MELCHGWGRRRIPMSNTKRYLPEELHRLCDRVSGPFWFKVEDKYIQIQSESGLKMACEAVSIYHDYISYNIPPEDGYITETTRMEAAALAHMEAESLDGEDYVISDEDMEYATEAYL